MIARRSSIVPSGAGSAVVERSILERALTRLTEGGWLGYGFVAPAMLVLGVLILGPLVYSSVLSLYSWRLTEINLPKTFSGLSNYRTLLHDATLGTALRNTFEFVISAVAIELALGFAIALALFNINRGRRLANAIILLPMITTPVIVALVWRYLFDPQFGIVNYAAHRTGYHGDIGWLSDPHLALGSIVAVDVWQWTPFVILVLHAGMLAIPDDLLEAARVDGAGAWQLVRRVILPHLTPLILLVLLFRTMDTYRLFDTVYVLTQGGPGLSTETVGLYTYRQGFIYLEMGYSLALSIVMLAIILVISIFYLRLLRRRA
jgi:multiple sugar transport system permease protein